MSLGPCQDIRRCLSGYEGEAFRHRTSCCSALMHDLISSWNIRFVVDGGATPRRFAKLCETYQPPRVSREGLISRARPHMIDAQQWRGPVKPASAYLFTVPTTYRNSSIALACSKTLQYALMSLRRGRLQCKASSRL
jgi:hypothetical protein